MGDPERQPDAADLPVASDQRRGDDSGQLPVHHQRADSQHILRQRDLHHPKGCTRGHIPYPVGRRGRDLRDQLDVIPTRAHLQQHERPLPGHTPVGHEPDDLHDLGEQLGRECQHGGGNLDRREWDIPLIPHGFPIAHRRSGDANDCWADLGLHARELGHLPRPAQRVDLRRGQRVDLGHSSWNTEPDKLHDLGQRLRGADELGDHLNHGSRRHRWRFCSGPVRQ